MPSVLIMPSPSIVPSPFLSIHRLLRRLQQKNRFVGTIPHSGLSPAETHFLLELDADSEHSVSSLAVLLRVDQSFSSRLAHELVRRKLIAVQQSSGDGRRKRLTITPAGRSLMKVIDQASTARYENFSETLNEREKRQLVELFKLIADGYGHPDCHSRSSDSEYRVQQRRITRCFGMLGEHVFGSSLSSSAWQLLAETVLSPVAPRPGELADLLSLAQNSLSSLIKTMTQKKLIVGQQDPDDRRSISLHALPQGRRVYTGIETAAESQLASALSAVKPAVVQQYLQVLQKFIGERDATLPPMPQHFEFEVLKSAEDRRLARGFLVRSAVAAGFEENLPDTLVGEEHTSFRFFTSESTLAVCTVSGKIPVISAAGWSKELTPWTLLSCISKVHQVVTPGQTEFSQKFVEFRPLRDYLKFA